MNKNAQNQKLGFSEFWDKSQIGSIFLEHFKKSNQNFNFIFNLEPNKDEFLYFYYAFF